MCIMFVLKVCIGCKLNYWATHHSVLSGRPQMCMYGILPINSPFNRKILWKTKSLAEIMSRAHMTGPGVSPYLVVYDRKHSEWYKKITFLKPEEMCNRAAVSLQPVPLLLCWSIWHALSRSSFCLSYLVMLTNNSYFTL